MCGVVGFTGNSPAVPVLLDGLSKLEYRGYDSAGVAVINEGLIEVFKANGRLAVLKSKINDGENISSHIGIGHTRWATHGKPSDENSHPQTSESGKFAVVHNGIIENYAVLKRELIASGVNFLSETDTEVIAHLLESNYDGDVVKAINKVTTLLRGGYALGIICSDTPEIIYAVRNFCPLIVGKGTGGNYIASDAVAILNYTRDIIAIEDKQIAKISPDKIEIFDEYLNPIDYNITKITWDAKSAEKDGHEHFMIKEILEQPRALRDTISPRINDEGDIVLDGVRLTREDINRINHINIVACGSAYYAGVVGKYVIESMCKIPVDVDVASEFRYRDPVIDERSLVIIISQSGETADTLAALREAKRKGARVLSVVNVVGSAIARESDDVLYTWAGPEISVATTKAYSTQLVMMYLISLFIAKERETMSSDEVRKTLSSIIKLPNYIDEILENNVETIKALSENFKTLEHAYFIGRGVDYAIALEASLKLKEISYIHAEAYAAGELKHGTISLIEEGTLVVALASSDRLFEKTVSNIKEVRARGAVILAITTESNRENIVDEADYTIFIPKTRELLMPSLEVVPMQLLGYYIALARGCDIDKPRNLAKSVTVE